MLPPTPFLRSSRPSPKMTVSFCFLTRAFALSPLAPPFPHAGDFPAHARLPGSDRNSPCPRPRTHEAAGAPAPCPWTPERAPSAARSGTPHTPTRIIIRLLPDETALACSLSSSPVRLRALAFTTTPDTDYHPPPPDEAAPASGPPLWRVQGRWPRPITPLASSIDAAPSGSFPYHAPTRIISIDKNKEKHNVWVLRVILSIAMDWRALIKVRTLILGLLPETLLYSCQYRVPGSPTYFVQNTERVQVPMQGEVLYNVIY